MDVPGGSFPGYNRLDARVRRAFDRAVESSLISFEKARADRPGFFMFEGFAFPPLNRLLRANPWALERLQPHAGKTALFTCPPWDVRATVTESGEMSPAGADATPDVVIVTTPGLLLRALSGDETAWTEVRLEGDVQFAGAIDYVRRNVRWDYEETLSRFVGDVAAHRIAGTVDAADRWRRTAAVNLARAIAEYTTHENPQIASAQAVEAFSSEVDRTRDDVDRLEKRIEMLGRQPENRQRPPG
jgi:ubiquinone biosynthesis accessory factor UbiJ